MVAATLGACGAPASQILAGGGADRQTWQRAVSVAQESVVRINVDTCDGSAKGSGFVVATGQIITNAHVVEGATSADFDQPEGANDPIQRWFANPTEDLAIVTTSSSTSKPLQLAQADPVPGDAIRVAGYPLGGALTITSGRVIEFVDGERYGQPGRIIRISAAIRPGNSGGPVLDSHGRVLGVVFAVQLADGVALAIPVSRLRADLADLTSMPAAPASC